MLRYIYNLLFSNQEKKIAAQIKKKTQASHRLSKKWKHKGLLRVDE